ncbi:MULTISPECIES: hypothetical protein [unclassified Fusobacterium]|uniref:hypothetical protein n=1 Tax=unclassified Fusobacterium TaxID=2648384 RepID=UPI001B8C8A39|nr:MULTISPECIES: hypothetical protein [unclassified Fusobacterium]MBR8702075.1 hypothetical protein [Fusobacterium sp. DD45]MBR8711870.1 hypothetical protein [Fusobacterium sp. DD28]MBR8752450.1 hypothetical protein [Fusobacterium sp. DD26]
MKSCRFDIFVNNSEKCPVCGSKFVEKIGKDSLVPDKENRRCKICGHKWKAVPFAKF